MILHDVAVLIGLGTTIGIVTSLWTARFVAALLYEVQSRDPVTLVSAASAFVAVGLLAGWLSARRAARVDPMIALRSE